jgi:hypothetical protein
MKFHFEFDIKKIQQPISLNNKLMLVGSCFTENIGEKLRKHKFRVLENPHGILFNPVSVADALADYISNKVYTESDVFSLNESWHSWKHHSRFSGLTQQESLDKINAAIKEAHAYLKEADYLILTLGSAWLYTLTEKAQNAIPYTVAANNHKAPADWFLKKLLNPSDATYLLNELIKSLQAFNPKLQIIFTISPVRHLREGLVENNRSKSVLIQAVHQLVESYEHLYYFPAYELVIDDLRDYRFYAEDLVHPNYQATQYVWEKLVEACVDDETKMLMKEIAEMNLAYQHKPFNPSTEMHQLFLKNYLKKARQLLEKHPYLNLSTEINYFENGIK